MVQPLDQTEFIFPPFYPSYQTKPTEDMQIHFHNYVFSEERGRENLQSSGQWAPAGVLVVHIHPLSDIWWV